MRVHNKFLVTASAVAIGLSGLLGAAARADSITGLYNTGVVSPGVVAADDLVDSHYSLASSPLFPSGHAQSVYVTDQLSFMFPGHYWLADTTTSKWISPQPYYTNSVPTDLPSPPPYTFETTFNSSGANPLGITGRFAVDNELVDIVLNNHTVATGGGSDMTWTPFTISSGFVSGLNTLDFVVFNDIQTGNSNNDGNPTGIQIQMAAVPLPAAAGVGFWMLGGFAGLGILRKLLIRTPRIA
jgi:hypothetical protein